MSISLNIGRTRIYAQLSHIQTYIISLHLERIDDLISEGAEFMPLVLEHSEVSHTANTFLLHWSILSVFKEASPRMKHCALGLDKHLSPGTASLEALSLGIAIPERA